MLEFHHEWSPDVSALTQGQMEMPLHLQEHRTEMPTGKASLSCKSTREQTLSVCTDQVSPAHSKILSLFQACASMCNHNSNPLLRHTDLSWFEIYDCTLLKEKIILSQSVSLLISTYELTVIRNLYCTGQFKEHGSVIT